MLSVRSDPRLYNENQREVERGDKQKSYKIMRMNMFSVEDKAKPDTRNIRGLNSAFFKLTTVQMTNLPL
jgi:hypothetical protein